MSRPVKAVIHLDAVKENLHVVRCLTTAKVTCVVKSNAYGHGVLPISRLLEKEGADSLAVACVEEAIELRHGGIKLPILLLEGCYEASELYLAEKYQLTVLLHNTEQVNMLLRHPAKRIFDVWMKVDTGMHRLGFVPECFLDAYTRIKNSKKVRSIVLATHFSCADEPDNPYTQMQIDRFNKIVRSLNEPISLCNSAALLHNYNTHDDWVRPGLMLFGASPFPPSYSHPMLKQLKPVMELTSQIIAVKQLPDQCAIGYGGTFLTKKPTRLGLVAIGYGDGYPRHLTTGTPIMVNQHKTCLLGRVSMDIISIDLTHMPEATIGTPVTLWGRDLPAHQIAFHADTVAHTLFCGIQRMKKEYVN